MTKEKTLEITNIIRNELITKEQLIKKKQCCKDDLLNWLQNKLVEVSAVKGYLIISDKNYNKINNINQIVKNSKYDKSSLIFTNIDVEVQDFYKQKLANKELNFIRLSKEFGCTTRHVRNVIFNRNSCKIELYENMLKFKTKLIGKQ